MSLAEDAVQLLTLAGVHLDSGLSDRELERIEQQLGFRFGEDHAALLTAVLPVGQHWPDWRRDGVEALQARLATATFFASRIRR